MDHEQLTIDLDLSNPPFRAGRHNSRNIYHRGAHFAVLIDPDYSAVVVDALNDWFADPAARSARR